MSGVDTSFSSSRISAMFLREEVVMKVLNFTVIVPVSSILLFHSAIRRHTKAFSQQNFHTYIVNIRSHVIYLLFCS